MLKLLGRLYREEDGVEGVEWVLIIAAIAVPLLGVLIYYRQQIGQWLTNNWNTVTGAGQQQINEGQQIPGS